MEQLMQVLSYILGALVLFVLLICVELIVEVFEKKDKNDSSKRK